MNWDDKDIGELFKDSFDGFEAEVSGDPWQAIQSNLQQAGLQSTTGAAASKGLFAKLASGWGIGLSSAIVGAVGFYAISNLIEPDQPVQKTAQVETKTIQPQEQVETNVSQEVVKTPINVNTDDVIRKERTSEEAKVVKEEQALVKETQPKVRVNEQEPKPTYNPGASAASQWLTQDAGYASYDPDVNTEVSPSSDQDQAAGQETAEDVVNENPVIPATSAPAIAIEDDPDFTATIESDIDGGWAPCTIEFNSKHKANTYHWSFGEAEGKSEEKAPSYTFETPGVYRVELEVESASGKLVKDFTYVEVKEGSSWEYRGDITPNVFSPNGDGLNERFIVPGVVASNLESLEIYIYNRSSQVVYTAKNLEAGWDGTMLNGAPAAEGTYVFIIKAVGIDGKEYTEMEVFLYSDSKPLTQFT